MWCIELRTTMTLFMFNTWTANSLQIVIFWSIFAAHQARVEVEMHSYQTRMYRKYDGETLMFSLSGLNVNYI